MLGRVVMVIIGWVGLGQEALCGNGKIPPGSLGLRLISSAILLVGLGRGISTYNLWTLYYHKALSCVVACYHVMKQ